MRNCPLLIRHGILSEPAENEPLLDWVKDICLNCQLDYCVMERNGYIRKRDREKLLGITVIKSTHFSPCFGTYATSIKVSARIL